MIGRFDIPSLPRGVRCHYDQVRQVDVLLAPERVLMLDHIGKAILSRVDGTAKISEIAADLAAVYNAPQKLIEADVIEYLQDLAEKRFLDVTHG